MDEIKNEEVIETPAVEVETPVETDTVDESEVVPEVSEPSVEEIA